jgi:glucan phosphoethanolaminetransferase (alkaline phosphatase superfamily)
MRVNVIRIVAIAIFYSRHLIEMFLSPKDAPVRGLYHLRVTAVIVAWAGAAAMVHILLSRRHYPPMMKFATALLDVLMITLLCAITGDAQTPLLLLYFAAIATAPLRLSLPLVYVTTFGSMLGYLCVLAYYAWYLVGFEMYYATPTLQIPRSHEIIVLLTMGVTGLLAGQVVRQARRMVERCEQFVK